MTQNKYQNYKTASVRINQKFSFYLRRFSMVILLSLIAFVALMFIVNGLSKIFNFLVYGFCTIIANLGLDYRGLFYLLDGEKILFEFEDFTKIDVMRTHFYSVKGSLYWILTASITISIILENIYIRLFLATADETHIRGGSFSTPEELDKILKKMRKQSKSDHPLTIGKLELPQNMEATHQLLAGDSGVGKSSQIMPHMRAIRARGTKAFIWDRSGEISQHFFREGHDIMLNPFDDRCAGWGIENEATELVDFESISESFIPSNESAGGAHVHWIESARTVFSWLFYRLLKLKGKLDPDTILKTLIATGTTVEENALGDDVIVTKREMDDIIKGSLATMTVNPDSPDHASGVIATLVPKIKSLFYLRGLEKRPQFSIREWVENDDDDRWVFIRVDKRQYTPVAPLISAWLDITIASVLALPKIPETQQRIWGFIDEFQSLDKMESLTAGLEEGRKHGLRLMLGFASVASIQERYSEKIMSTINTNCGIKLFFRASDPSIAEWASKTLTHKEVITDKTSIQTSTQSDSTGISEQRERLAIVSPDELMLLPRYKFYLRLPGDLPITLNDTLPIDMPVVNEIFIKRQLPDEVDYSQLSQPDEEETTEEDKEGTREKSRASKTTQSSTKQNQASSTTDYSEYKDTPDL